MLKATVAALALSSVLAQTPAPVAEHRSAGEIFSRSSPAVVTIRTPTGQGSGVLIDPAGVIVSNFHTVKGDAKASVTLANGDVYDDVRVIDVDQRRDLILLKIKGYKLPVAELGDSDDLAVGAEVYAIGTPKGLTTSISGGLVSALRGSGEGYRVVQTTAAMSPGSSGGGLFDTAGRLMAITTFTVEGGEALNFAIPINYVRGMLATEPTMTLAELAKATAPEKKADPAPARPSVPKLSRVYVNGASSDIAMFETRDNGTIETTLSSPDGVVYGRATLAWDPARKLYAGAGNMKASCGRDRSIDVPVTQEVAVVTDSIIRDRWSMPAKLNCGKGVVLEYEYKELIRYVPPAK